MLNKFSCQNLMKCKKTVWRICIRMLGCKELTKWQPHKIIFTNNINKQTRKKRKYEKKTNKERKNRHKDRKSCVLQVKRTELYCSATNLHRNWIHRRHLKSLGMDLKTNKTLCIKVESQGWFRKQRTYYVNACPKAPGKNKCFFFFISIKSLQT